MLKEFKEFALKGSVIDLAIGVIIGASFNKIVSSLVTDIITPPLSLLTGKIDLNNLYISLSGSFKSLAAAQKAGAPVITYGAFLNNVIEFALVAFVLFLIIRQVNRVRLKPEAAPDTKECPFCLSSVPIKATKCMHCTSSLTE